MRVWIDICHTPQYNFFKPVIEELARRGHEVYVTVLERGKTPKIVAEELEGMAHVSVAVIGKHKMTKWSAIWDANLLRVWQLIRWARKKKLEVAISTNIFTPLVGGLFGMKSYSFGDDPQVWDFHPKGWLSTKAYQTLYEWTMDKKQPRHTEVLRCLKEWAYLNPRTFVPNEKVLEKYGVKPKEYLFLREVTVGTINYAGQASGAILGIKDMIPAGMKVLFSLEEKKRRDEYPADWILLQEPIEDIHSLIYYSAGLVSSGDSMAREAALLGVPSYYLGIRYSMPANAAASKVASLQNQKTMPFEEWIERMKELRNEGIKELKSEGELTNEGVKELKSERTKRLLEEQRKLREHIDNEFIDINAYMLALVENNK